MSFDAVLIAVGVLVALVALPVALLAILAVMGSDKRGRHRKDDDQ